MIPHLAEDLGVQIDAVLGAPRRIRTFHIWGAAMQVVQSDALVRAPLVIKRMHQRSSEVIRGHQRSSEVIMISHLVIKRMHRRERRGTPALVRP